MSVLIKILTLTTNMSQNVDLLQELLQKGLVGEARQATTDQYTTERTTFSTQVYTSMILCRARLTLP